MSYLAKVLNQNPVIAAVKSISDIQKVPEKINVILILYTDIFYLEKMIDLAVAKDLLVLLHVDLFKGLSRDEYGIKYLAQKTGIDGIVSTKGYLIKAAKKYNLIVVQRLFILDSSAFEKALRIVNDAQPDFIEVLPGLVYPRIAKKLRRRINQPLIAGGMIEKTKDIDDILAAKAIAISTSNKKLWTYRNY